MRKKVVIFSVISIAILILAIVGIFICMNKEPKIIEISSQNFEEYIIFNASLEDFNVEKGRGLYAWNKGTAKLIASAKLRKDVEANNIIITGRAILDGLCWAGKIYNFTLELDKNGEAEYSSQITTGEGGMLYPDKPTFFTIDEPNENEFIFKNVYLTVNGTIKDK